MSCHIIPCHTMSYHVMSCHIISYHIISHHTAGAPPTPSAPTGAPAPARRRAPGSPTGSARAPAELVNFKKKKGKLP